MTLKDKDTVRIMVNLKEIEIPVSELSEGDEISYGQVLEIAIKELPTGEYIEYEIYYEKAADRPDSGELKEGAEVKIQDGTIFNVTYTDRS